ncbi:hypothetical protein RFW18_07060 [Metabacillus idriensis]|uniref:hypothetical protein n=1 Tax=Metabacillus idriensis TaxID=324768 RepID=UPI00281352A4|nr:hypothetical protein [Metabacillus idriensis]MDR0137506.1 hypothetical protein [Metabacillus idriensis]
METIAGYAQKAIVQFGHKVAVKDRFRSFSYTQLGERAYKLVNILRNMGMKKGDRLEEILINDAVELLSYEEDVYTFSRV